MNKFGIYLIAAWIVAGSYVPHGMAMDLDWTGQFRVENHWVLEYPLIDNNLTNDAAKTAAGGYYIPGGGSESASFQTIFLRLRPSLIVNDNISIKSEWWVGDPVMGLFGSGAPYAIEQRQFYSNQTRSATLSAQRFWGEFQSDVGVFQVGRMPLHWGLGIVWNNGESLWDRTMSTADGVRLKSKFGFVSVAPAFLKFSAGNNIGGACQDPITGGSPCTTTTGGGGVSDFSLLFSYDNPDEDLELGINLVKRLAGAAQDSTATGSGILGIDGSPAGMNYIIYDIFGMKRLGDFTIRGEVPITDGNIGSVRYNAWSAALESSYKFSENWDASIKGGHVPGQPGIAIGSSPDAFRGFYFHPNYKIALIMFNYQFYNFAGPNMTNNSAVSPAALRSPYDNPLTNANYLSVHGGFKTGKWSFSTDWAFATALNTASPGEQFFNTWTRSYVDVASGVSAQGSFLGWEMDYGIEFEWDEPFRFGVDFGFWFPGSFYRFSNTTTENDVEMAFASVLKLGVVF